jgi:hypothetical protein
MPSFTAVSPRPGLLALPWALPLEDWPEEIVVALPRGISRHIVRFVRADARVIAVKEMAPHVALREHQLLRELRRLDLPVVSSIGVVTDRITADGEPLDALLLTDHLAYSLPYRAVFAGSPRPDTVQRLVDALAVLLVRLHLDGFSWGDCSLSNTLFRRDADAFAAYLVDAETGDLRHRLSEGQRAYDVDLAMTNIFGELLDIQAAGVLAQDADLHAVTDRLDQRYRALWNELVAPEEFTDTDTQRISSRVRRLNDLGFDVAEIDIVTDIGGNTVRIQPKVVDAGFHRQRLLHLTGLDVEENQARRLLNDIAEYAVMTDQQALGDDMLAHEWLTQVFEPVVQGIPADLRSKLEPAQLYHEVLEHRWYSAEQAGRDVGIDETLSSYTDRVLRHRPDELVALDPETGELAVFRSGGEDETTD